MNRVDLNARLAEIASSVFQCSPNVFHADTTAADVPRWDSFNHVKLLVAIEDEFGLRFSNLELKSPQNWGQLGDLVAKHHIG